MSTRNSSIRARRAVASIFSLNLGSHDFATTFVFPMACGLDATE